MARRLSSARFRRRLGWGLGATVVAGAVAMVVSLLPEHGEPALAHATSNAPSAVYHPPPYVGYTLRERRTAALVLLDFVESAVIRRHLVTSYDLVTPTLRQGLSRRDWTSGAIPIVPFPVGTDLHGAILVRSVRGELDYRVSLFPPKRSGQKPTLFDLTLKRVGRHWLVDSWAPSLRGLYGPNGVQDPPGLGGQVLEPTNPQLSRTWIYAPIGAVFLALLLGPLVLGGRWLAERRRLRALL